MGVSITWVYFSMFSTKKDKRGIRDHLGIINNSCIHLDEGNLISIFRENSRNLAIFSGGRGGRWNPEPWWFHWTVYYTVKVWSLQKLLGLQNCQGTKWLNQPFPFLSAVNLSLLFIKPLKWRPLIEQNIPLGTTWVAFPPGRGYSQTSQCSFFTFNLYRQTLKSHFEHYLIIPSLFN